MYIDYQELSPSEIYHLMTQTIIPRPIAWVLTENKQQQYNLAPFSYFTPIASEPPLVLFSVGQKSPGQDKDTVVNLRENPHMVIHIANAAQAGEVTQTAATLDYGQSEIEHAGLALVDFEGTELKRINGAPIAMACELYQLNTLGAAPQTLVIAKINAIHVEDTAVSRDAKGRISIDPSKIDPLARLGAASYSALTDAFSLQRPK